MAHTYPEEQSVLTGVQQDTCPDLGGPWETTSEIRQTRKDRQSRAVFAWDWEEGPGSPWLAGAELGRLGR